MRAADSCSSAARPRARQRRGDPVQRGVGRRPGGVGDAPAATRRRRRRRPAARPGATASATPRSSRRVEQLVLGVGGVERVERRGGSARVGGARCWSATSASASSRSMPASTKRSMRRGEDVERLGQLRGRALGRGGRVVELVGQPGGHRAERGQPLAVVLDLR